MIQYMSLKQYFKDLIKRCPKRTDCGYYLGLNHQCHFIFNEAFDSGKSKQIHVEL